MTGAGRGTAPGTWTPRSGAAPLPRMVLATGTLEFRLLLRNGEQLLLAAVIPLLVLIAGTYAPIELGPGRRVDVLVPGVLALAVISTAFTSLAISTAFERRYGVLKRLGASPLPRGGLLAGKALAVLAVEALQVVLIAGTGLLLGWRPQTGAVGVAATLVLWVTGTAAFAAAGLLMAGLLRAEATLAGANLVYLVLLVGGAVIFPAAEYPGALAEVVAWTPSGALAEGVRTALAQNSFAWLDLAVLAGWGLLAGTLTARTFRWD